MDLDNRLKDLSKYNISFEIKDGYYHIVMTYNPKWDIVKSDKDIHIEVRENKTHYIADINNVCIDDLFEAIDNTIKYNIELENKLILFREKSNQLLEIFSKEDINRLNNIIFVFEDEVNIRPKKSRRKSNKKNKDKSISPMDTDNDLPNKETEEENNNKLNDNKPC